MSNRLPTLREAGISLKDMRRTHGVMVENHGNLANPGSDFLSAIMGGGNGPLAARVTETTALGVSTVFSCVHYIASIIATLPIELHRTLPGGSREIALGHPVRRLMRQRPNPLMVSSDVRYALAYNQALHHNAYAKLVFNRAGQAVEIWPLRSSRVTMRIENGFPRYRVSAHYDSFTQQNWTDKDYGFDEILHLRGMSPDGLRGTGPLSLGANLVGLAQALEENASRFFTNSSRPGGVYSTAAGVVLTPEQRAAMREQLDSIHRGVENAFKTLVMEGGGSFVQARANNDSSQFDEIAKRTHQQICQLFGVPPHKVGILDNATFSNIEQQQIQAVQDLFLPWCRRWEEAFTGALLPPAEQDSLNFKHKLDGLLRGDIVTRTQAQVSWLQNGVLSINEVREMEDRDPIEGGDEHVRQLNMAPITMPPEPPKPIKAPIKEAA